MGAKASTQAITTVRQIAMAEGADKREDAKESRFIYDLLTEQDDTPGKFALSLLFVIIAESLRAWIEERLGSSTSSSWGRWLHRFRGPNSQQVHVGSPGAP